MLFQLEERLSADYITGKLTPSIYSRDCVFVDPTTNVKGVETYSKAVASLFDKANSRADLISIEVNAAHAAGLLMLDCWLESCPVTGTSSSQMNERVSAGT